MVRNKIAGPSGRIHASWLPKRDPAKIYVFTLPESSGPPASLVDSEVAREWWTRFTELRHAEADKLMELADAAIQAKQPALAYELVREAVRENPDQAPGRKILGQQNTRSLGQCGNRPPTARWPSVER